MFLMLFLLVTGSTSVFSSNEGDGRLEFGFNMFRRTTTTVKPTLRRNCNCSCGVRNEASRIVGGEATLSNEFPWMVRLNYFNRFYCGGMLLNDRYVLSAAHCVRGFIWFMIKVTLGEHDRCSKATKPETRFVIRAFTGNFGFLSMNNDIALLRLNDVVPLTDTIRPICLPRDPAEMYAGAKAIATGWGTLNEGGGASCVLQEVELPVISNENCKKDTSYSPNFITDGMLCAGYEEGMRDTCQGDSGGPLIHERDDKKYELIGIVSWGNGCARPGYPGVYTRVTKYIDWIIANSADGWEAAADRVTTDFERYLQEAKELYWNGGSKPDIQDHIFGKGDPT